MVDRRLVAIESAMRRFTPAELAHIATIAIDRLDALGPDPDGEDNGDDEPGGDEADTAWSEWNTRGRHKLASGEYEMGETRSLASDEDAEDDDPDTGAEDAPGGFDPEEDMCLAGDHGCGPVLTRGAVHWGARQDDEEEPRHVPADMHLRAAANDLNTSS